MTQEECKTSNGLWHFERNLRKYESFQGSQTGNPDYNQYKTRPQRKLDTYLAKPKTLTIPFFKLSELKDKDLKNLVKRTLKFNKSCQRKNNNN